LEFRLALNETTSGSFVSDYSERGGELKTDQPDYGNWVSVKKNNAQAIAHLAIPYHSPVFRDD
jgi:hypothetical protein